MMFEESFDKPRSGDLTRPSIERERAETWMRDCMNDRGRFSGRQKMSPILWPAKAGSVNLWATVLIHTRLQPGDRECQEKRKPFRRFPAHRLPRFPWLKPGVNEIGLIRTKNLTASGSARLFV